MLRGFQLPESMLTSSAKEQVVPGTDLWKKANKMIKKYLQNRVSQQDLPWTKTLTLSFTNIFYYFNAY